VYGALYKFEGQVSVFNYQNGPTYRCLFPTPPEVALNCNEAGVLGVLPGIIGLYMANEVLKLILGTGAILSFKIQLFNALTNETTAINISKNVNLKIDAMQTEYEFPRKSLCTYDDPEIREIDLDDFQDLLKLEATFLDVRVQWEYPKLTSHSILEIPLDQLENRAAEIPTDRQVILFCHSGGRSKIAIHLLTERFGFKNLYNLKGGLQNYPSEL
jgi:adenylyltransferase/sulfurtransferase